MDVSDLFSFVLLGGGKGGAPEAPRRGGRLSMENPRKGGGSCGWWGGGPRGRKGVCRELGGGGLNIFISGPKGPPSREKVF